MTLLQDLIPVLGLPPDSDEIDVLEGVQELQRERRRLRSVCLEATHIVAHLSQRRRAFFQRYRRQRMETGYVPFVVRGLLLTAEDIKGASRWNLRINPPDPIDELERAIFRPTSEEWPWQYT